jgi:hypothetical protein
MMVRCHEEDAGFMGITDNKNYKIWGGGPHGEKYTRLYM